MPSTRESSPAVSETGSSSTPQLSPNSRVKALLNSIPDDSDEESFSGDARARLLKTLKASKVSNSDTQMDTTKEVQKDISTAEEDSDEEQVVIPRGRVAGAMRAQNPSSNHSTPTRKRADKTVSPIKRTTESTSASDESDVPVVSRKRKIRVSRHSTPEPILEDEPASPGLFVSPNNDTPGEGSDSYDLPALDDNTRFKALVAKKGQEMRAKEQAAQESRQRKEAELQRYSDALDADDLVGSDEEAGRRLTQQMKPTRKASKRALEEMHRETQRLSRNQQLAHYATTKKTYSTKDFLKRFDTKIDKTPELPSLQSTEPTSSSPTRGSDAELKGTPPSSPPPSAADDLQKSQDLPSLMEGDDDDLPTLEKVLTSSPPARKDKGKGRAIEELAPEPKLPKAPIFKHRPIRVRPPPMQDRKTSPLDESDSDLEIISVKPTIKTRIAEVFDRVPAQKGAGNHHALRLLAHLGSPGKQNTGRNKKPSMTTSEMQISLQQRARQQATREREERLQAARDRGVIIQTAEERQQEMAEVEDLLSRARREGDEITKREKAAAKKERKDSGEADPLGESSDDEDWVEEKNKTLVEENSGSGSGSEASVDESGSEDDASAEEEGDAMDMDDNVAKATNPLFDDEASTTDEDEAEADLSMDEMAEALGNDEDEEDLPNLQQNRRMRNVNVISDDEDESEVGLQTPSIAKTVSPIQFNTKSPIGPTSVLRSATKTFIPGVSVTGPVGLGLTQIFAGTMDDSQFSPSPSDRGFQQNNAEKDPLAFLRNVPAPELPAFMPTMEEDTQAFLDTPSQMSHVPESQPMEEDTQELDLQLTQSQVHGFDSFVDNSQMSPFPDATQDVGFAEMTPIKGRFVDSPVTVRTLVMDPSELPESVQETPIVKKKGRLHRRAPVVFSDDEDAAEPIDLGEDFEINESIFDVMRKAAKPKKIVVDEFNKKKSGAKEMVNEQADESEDEYAGLGGASDDESGGEADEYVKAMIDDESGQNVDKNQIAAFYADRERANDEKQVEKLYKDITSGMMRRKRGADYDLSDSDDGGEARRRMKRKDFAKMRKALLADERIGKIAENPKRQAFLRAIEDRGSDDDPNFLDDFPEPEEEESQSQSQAETPQVISNSQPGDMGPPKRKRSDDSQEISERLPPNLRRTKPTKKPSNLSEIRDSLSSLIEEQDSLIVPDESGSESDGELEIEGQDDSAPREKKDKENRDPFALRRTKPEIIDRISLKRESSSTISNSTRLAFAVSTSASFKVPALLRRATTNNSVTSNSSVSTSATERMAGASGEGVKRGGGKNSGVNYFARETERRAAVAKTEARREKKRFKGAETRRKAVGGLLGKGKFE